MHGEELGGYAYGMWPILIFAYYKLAMREERDVEKQFGQEFLEYKRKVPAFIPRFGKEV